MAPVTRCEFSGRIGELLEAVTGQWLLVAPDANPAMLEMFADRDTTPLRNLVPWAGEFAGKYLTSAVEVYRATGDGRLVAAIDSFVAELASLQDTDGYLGPWPRGSRLSGKAPNASGGTTWDAWGHYHLLYGLLAWNRCSGSEPALEVAVRIGDLLCTTFLGEGKPRLVDTGSTEMNLAPIHGLALLHARTHERRYLALALELVEELSAAGPDGPLAGDYLEQALAGSEFFEMPKPRWESLHPIMGLAELYRCTGDERFREAFERIWWSIVCADRHNNGGFSSGERATGNPCDRGAIETCCTIAWIAASVEMQRLTNDPLVADELELSTLNSVVGMHSPSGRWATYNTPSDGARFASAHHIVFQARSGSPELNCCSVNSPRGLGLIAEWAVVSDDKVVRLNYYGPSRFVVSGPQEIVLEQRTDYPAGGTIALEVSVAAPIDFALALRVPSWSKRTVIRVDGNTSYPPAGCYHAIDRRWVGSALIEIELDLGLHFWRGERECERLVSVYRGPVLLACDLRYNRERSGTDDAPEYGKEPGKTGGTELGIPRIDGKMLALEPVAWQGRLAPWQLFESAVRLCDFGSAGATGSIYRSWLPIDGVEDTSPFSPRHLDARRRERRRMEA